MMFSLQVLVLLLVLHPIPKHPPMPGPAQVCTHCRFVR